MIYVHRDWSIIEQNIKDDLVAAANELDAIQDRDLRKKFIAENASRWSAVRDYLSRMSHRKCWYSEASERVSPYQIDHFRPHGRAKQAAKDRYEGYSWLAFDLENFRLAGALCNMANREYSDETVGKADWFPLANADRRATLAARDHSRETPILLDPTDPEDPPKLTFIDDGTIAPSPTLDETARKQVEMAILYLGLAQNQLNEARRRAWRQCNRAIEQYSRFAAKAKGERTIEESKTMNEKFQELIGYSKPEQEFASVFRCCLAVNGLSHVIQRDELAPLALEI